MKDAVTLRHYLLQQHPLSLLSILHGARRFDNDDFIYVKNLGDKNHSAIMSHFAYPSCLLHYPGLPLLKGHVQMTHITRKRAAPNDNNLCFDNSSDAESVLVLTCQDVISFSAWSASTNEPNRPKLPTTTAQTLAPLSLWLLKMLNRH